MEDKINEFEISGMIYNLDNKYTEDEILEMFLDWVESKDLFFGGSIKKYEEE